MIEQIIHQIRYQKHNVSEMSRKASKDGFLQCGTDGLHKIKYNKD